MKLFISKLDLAYHCNMYSAVWLNPLSFLFVLFDEIPENAQKEKDKECNQYFFREVFLESVPYRKYIIYGHEGH